MQSRIRKTRSAKSDRPAGIYSFTSIKQKIASIAFLLVFLSSCAHSGKPKPSKNFSKEIENLCLSGEGRGRIEYFDRKYVFSYENLLNLENKEWLLGLSLPLHGEELLKINFSDKIRIKGNFYKRLALNAQRENKLEYERLKFFMSDLGAFLKIVALAKSGQSPCLDGKCFLDKSLKFSLSKSRDEAELMATFKKRAGSQLQFSAKNPSPFYKKLIFKMLQSVGSKRKMKPFSLTLIQSECSAKK